MQVSRGALAGEVVTESLRMDHWASMVGRRNRAVARHRRIANEVSPPKAFYPSILALSPRALFHTATALSGLVSDCAVHAASQGEHGVVVASRLASRRAFNSGWFTAARTVQAARHAEVLRIRALLPP